MDMDNAPGFSVPPKLLVSVRDPRESIAAVEGGCDILDIKEPKNGSLGMADISTIQSIVESIHGRSTKTPVSAALGEVTDWSESVDVPKLPNGLSFVKLGLAGLADNRDWVTRWRSVRSRFEQTAQQPLNWIAVAYADWQLANSPPPLEVIQAASSLLKNGDWLPDKLKNIEEYKQPRVPVPLFQRPTSEESAVGILIDTWSKAHGPLYNHLSFEELAEIAETARSAGLLLAIAGSFRAEMLFELARIEPQPDIVAIRTAACRNRDRAGEVTAEAVREFKTSMDMSFEANCKVPGPPLS